jgi:hypothetical protein
VPIHDWTRVGANRFHQFHLSWTVGIRRALNDVLTGGYFALAQPTGSRPATGLAVRTLPKRSRDEPPPGTALAEAPVITCHQAQAEAIRYSRKADRVVIYHPDGIVVAVIEILSPGNKASVREIKAFAIKTTRYLLAGIHMLIVDLFPPTKRDPQGIHKLIWDRIEDAPFALPADKPLTLASYSAGGILRAFVEPVGVGDVLPDMPVFLDPDHYVSCPLEATYQESWRVFPRALKAPLEESPRA